IRRRHTISKRDLSSDVCSSDLILSKRITRNINPFRRNDLSIGFFQGCIMDSFFANINELAIKIMKKHYVQVTNIPKQGCCGALQHHAGETAQTVELAMKNIAAYEKY